MHMVLLLGKVCNDMKSEIDIIMRLWLFLILIFPLHLFLRETNNTEREQRKANRKEEEKEEEKEE